MMDVTYNILVSFGEDENGHGVFLSDYPTVTYNKINSIEGYREQRSRKSQ